MLRLLRAGVHFYLIGLIILTLGIALSVQSMLGTSPFDALLVGLYRTFGLTIGSWEIVVGLAMVIGNAVIERRRPEYFALITAFVTGIGIDSWLFILRLWGAPELLIGKSIFIFFGVVLTGLGIAIYLQSEVAPNPMDRSMLIVSNLTGWNMTYSRALINVLLVITAFFFNGAIGIGTLLHAIFAGVFISLFLPFSKNLRQESLAKVSVQEAKVAE